MYLGEAGYQSVGESWEQKCSGSGSRQIPALSQSRREMLELSPRLLFGKTISPSRWRHAEFSRRWSNRGTGKTFKDTPISLYIYFNTNYFASLIRKKSQGQNLYSLELQIVSKSQGETRFQKDSLEGVYPLKRTVFQTLTEEKKTVLDEKLHLQVCSWLVFIYHYGWA